MDLQVVTRATDALTFTTTPTDVMRFLAQGDGESPDVSDEMLAPGDGPPDFVAMAAAAAEHGAEILGPPLAITLAGQVGTLA